MAKKLQIYADENRICCRGRIRKWTMVSKIMNAPSAFHPIGG